MANVYDPTSLGVQAPSEGFQQGGWYQGRQYWNNTLSDPGVIHPESSQQGAGQAVSSDVNRQSDTAQGLQSGTIDKYLATLRQQSSAIAPKANVQTTGNVPGSAVIPQGSAGVSAGSVLPQPTINLPGIYENLYEKSGVKAKQEQLSKMEKEFIDAKGIVNDNPFLSEGSRVGREAKLRTLFDERTANLRNEIAQSKADIETQLNLQTKQFDINSQQAQLALNQFNTLLDMGALDAASGEDIASITRSTGLGSSVIQSAIQARQTANLSTQIKTFDDGENEGFIIFTIDKNGNVVNQSRQVTGTSTKKATFDFDSFASNYAATYGDTDTSGDITSVWDE